MIKEKLTLATAKKIVRMFNGESIPASALSKMIANELSNEGVLGTISRGSRSAYYLLDKEACRKYIETNYLNGNGIESWITLMESSHESVSRATMVKEMGDSKLLSVRTFRGFLVNCCEPIEVRVKGQSVTLSPIDGIATFIQDPDSFVIPSDVVVVGIENGENFRLIRRQRYLFCAEKILFVSRYPQSVDLRNWLIGISNQYVHFGDFDLAGINIYMTEFYKYLNKRASFFVPEDIEERIKNGNSDLYDKQYAKFSNMSILDERLRPLVEIIHKYRRVYEQEGYIE